MSLLALMAEREPYFDAPHLDLCSGEIIHLDFDSFCPHRDLTSRDSQTALSVSEDSPASAAAATLPGTSGGQRGNVLYSVTGSDFLLHPHYRIYYVFNAVVPSSRLEYNSDAIAMVVAIQWLRHIELDRCHWQLAGSIQR